ncbi:MAG: hypothetical protein NC548_50495 [Lachnospiraceae bacterium]|nr:hypothetical protein [Lachnospiraceae bacterium]
MNRLNPYLLSRYFNSELAQEFEEDRGTITHYGRNEATLNEMLYINMFISVFEAGDKFESNELDKQCPYVDVTNKFDFNDHYLQHYCKVYEYYRNYAWKVLCGTSLSNQGRSVRISKFLDWLHFELDDSIFCSPNKNAYGGSELANSLRQTMEGYNVSAVCALLGDFIHIFNHFVKGGEIIVLPKSRRIIRLLDRTVQDVQEQRDVALCQYAGQAEADLFRAIDEALDEMDKAEE